MARPDLRAEVAYRDLSTAGEMATRVVSRAASGERRGEERRGEEKKLPNLANRPGEARRIQLCRSTDDKRLPRSRLSVASTAIRMYPATI
jgi:hypothetical protein